MCFILYIMILMDTRSEILNEKENEVIDENATTNVEDKTEDINISTQQSDMNVNTQPVKQQTEQNTTNINNVQIKNNSFINKILSLFKMKK